MHDYLVVATSYNSITVLTVAKNNVSPSWYIVMYWYAHVHIRDISTDFGVIQHGVNWT